ncbi:MAG: metallophosphoesterase [archaeon]
MKILAAGDLHGDAVLAKRLAEKAKEEKVDLVILAGDLTYADTSTKGLIGPFTKEKKKVLIIPGNHETVATTDFLVQLYPNLKSLHGHSVRKGDVGIFGCGGANIGLFRISEEEIYNLLKKGFEGVKDAKKKVMVTHVHPSETLMGKLTNIFSGSASVRKAIEQFKPDIALCSHVHEAEGIEEKIGKTRVINVGRKGKIIEI